MTSYDVIEPWLNLALQGFFYFYLPLHIAYWAGRWGPFKRDPLKVQIKLTGSHLIRKYLSFAYLNLYAGGALWVCFALWLSSRHSR